MTFINIKMVFSLRKKPVTHVLYKLKGKTTSRRLTHAYLKDTHGLEYVKNFHDKAIVFKIIPNAQVSL